MLDPEQKKVFQRMSYSQKARCFFRLRESARAIKKSGVREAHPDWSDEQVSAAVNEAFLNAGK